MRLRVANLQPGQVYAVQFRSTNGEASSEWSPRFLLDVMSDPTIPASPESFTILNAETTQFYLVWDEVTTNDDATTMVDFDHYEILFRNDDDTTALVETKNAQYTLTLEENTNLLGDMDGIPATKVYAKVRAVDQSGNAGEWTTELSATNGAPDVVTSSDSVPLVDSIRIRWVPSLPLPEDFKEYRVHRVIATGAEPHNTFVPDDSNLIWHGVATNYLDSTTDYTHFHWYKVMLHDVFGNISEDDADKDVSHAKPNTDGGGSGSDPRPPSGPAGGDLAGTYPNPTVPNGKAPNFVASHLYDTAALVVQGGILYRANTSFTSTGSFDPADWTAVGGGGGGGGTTVGGVDIDCGDATAVGVTIDCGGA